MIATFDYDEQIAFSCKHMTSLQPSTGDSTVQLVLCNAPDRTCAEHIARTLVGQGLAACANLLPDCLSIYSWQGQVEHAHETPMLIKTTAVRLPEVIGAIQALHPYEVPEIIALPVTEGLPAYLQWVRDQTLPLDKSV